MHFGCNFAHHKVNYHFCHTKDNPLRQDKICKLQAAWYETAPSPHPPREIKNKRKEEPKMDYGEIQQSICRKLVDILSMQIKLIMSFASRKSTCNHLKKKKNQFLRLFIIDWCIPVQSKGFPKSGIVGPRYIQRMKRKSDHWQRKKYEILSQLLFWEAQLQNITPPFWGVTLSKKQLLKRKAVDFMRVEMIILFKL